jgi:hypothetical protein
MIYFNKQVLSACLRSAGSAAADVAWDVISANPELTTTAALLEELDMNSSLSNSIYGTLLLPDNTVSASQCYNTSHVTILR